MSNLEILCVAKLPENLSVTPQETALPDQPSALDSPWDCEGEVGITTSISEARRADSLQMCVVHALLVFLAKATTLCTEEVGTEPEEQLSTFCYKTKLSVLIKVKYVSTNFTRAWALLVSALILGQAFTTTKYLFKSRTFLSYCETAHSWDFWPFGSFYSLLNLYVHMQSHLPTYTSNHTHIMCTLCTSITDL